MQLKQWSGTFHQMRVLVILILVASLLQTSTSKGKLKVGFYDQICPDAENIVSNVIRQEFLLNRDMAPALLRLHFHDCFVQGCDGSILIEGENAENQAVGHQGLRGFEVIEKAKAELERICPGVVSCADIVAMAARDMVSLVNGPFYRVETGRRDGEVSNMSLADEMPDVTDSIKKLKELFFKKGLSEKDLVVLSGAHTIGTTACFFMTQRLYNFTPGGGTDPSINEQFLPELQSRCPPDGDTSARLPMDQFTSEIFDNQILQNIRGGFAVLQSDAALYKDKATKRVVDSYFDMINPMFGPSFEADFASSMVKMGNIGVKTGSEGTIRRVCGAFN